MGFGLDYVSGPDIATLQAQKVTFVCRYLSEENALTVKKILTLAEAQSLGAAKIALVSNYEWYAARALEGRASGVADADIAAKQHAACGGPENRPIYFSVDFQATEAQLPAIGAYCEGIASRLGFSRTAAYGSYLVIKYLFDNKLISYGWQTYAWSGGQWDPRANIRQYLNSMTMGGRSVDYDESRTADFGQWIYGEPSMGIPAGWKDDGATLSAPNGVVVVQGFREWVLSHNWDPGNLPLQAEEGRDPVEDSNPSLGGGTWQPFRWTILEWTARRGVFLAWGGQELVYLRTHQAPAPTNTKVDTSVVQADLKALAADETKAEADLSKL